MEPACPLTQGNLVEDCSITATGDDCIAFFNAAGTIRNCQLTDSYARGILLFKSPNVILENNTFARCEVLKK